MLSLVNCCLLCNYLVLSIEIGAPKSVAIGIYQELRIVPDILISIKKYIIEPLLLTGSTVDLFFSIRTIDHIGDSAKLTRSIKSSGLMKYVVKVNVFEDSEVLCLFKIK